MGWGEERGALPGRVRLNLCVCRAPGVLGDRFLQKTNLGTGPPHVGIRTLQGPLVTGGGAGGCSEPLCSRCCSPSFPSPQEGPDQAAEGGTGAGPEAHPCLQHGRLEAIRGLGGARPAPLATGLGFLEGAGHPRPAEPMPGLPLPVPLSI